MELSVCADCRICRLEQANPEGAWAEAVGALRGPEESYRGLTGQ